MTHSSPSSEPTLFRAARRADLARIIALLADDGIGRNRELASGEPDLCYRAAFETIDRDPRNVMLVAEKSGEVIGYCQITFIPGLSRRGAERALIESVRIASELRGQGLGAAMMKHCIDMAKARGTSLVQLTSDKRRADAHRFYERLGFVRSHDGFKLDLGSRNA